MAEDKTIKNILIVVAMEAEAAPFIEHMGFEKKDDFFPSQVSFQAYQGIYHDCHVTVVTNGKDTVYGTGMDQCGTVPAALVTFSSLQILGSSTAKVDLVLNAGTCGGFSRQGAAIGDVYCTSGVANHDRRIPIPPFIPYGIGALTTTCCPKLMAEHGFKAGICTTGNSLDKTDEDDKLMLLNNASVKDMEAAAIAWVCEMYDKTPYLGIKVVTDIVDGDRPTQEEFLEHLSTAAQSLQKALPKVIEHVCGRHWSDL